MGGAIIVDSDLVTYPNSILSHSMSLTPTDTSILYDVQIFRNGSLYYQSVDNTGTTTITDSDFTLNSGSYTLKVGTADTNGITFNTSNIEWEINGYFGGESLQGAWTDVWRNGGISLIFFFPDRISENVFTLSCFALKYQSHLTKTIELVGLASHPIVYVYTLVNKCITVF